VEGPGGDVASKNTPVRAVRCRAYILAGSAAALAGLSREEGHDWAVGEGVGILDEYLMGDGGIADLMEDGRSWRSAVTTTGVASTPDEDG
jgi:hypothetical protein